MTTGPIGATLIAFALPTLGSNILQSLNGSINTIWVGRFLGEDALAATSNANIIMFLMFGLVFGFGMAATIMVGQAWGRHDVDAAKRAFGSAIGLVLVASVVTAIAGWVFAPEILRALATPGRAYDEALAYLRVIFLGLPASMLLVLMFMGLRGIGDSLTPLWFMGLSVVLDSTLNPVFILGLGPAPELGIAGSATATLVANVVACGALILYIRVRDLPLSLTGAEVRYIVPSAALARTITAKGLPIGAQMLVISGAGLAMVGLVNRNGVDTTAAYGITQQIWTYIQMPAMAIGAAVSAMAAQNIGAGRWDRVGRITRAGLFLNVAITGATVAIALLFDRALLSLFVPADSAVLPIARHINVIATWGFILFGGTMILFGVVRANGAVWGPLAILFLAMFPVRLGIALLLRPMLGVDALWWSFPAGSAATVGLAALYYRFGGWRKGALLAPDSHCEERSHADIEPAGTVKPVG
ncbi:MATE family efflux transporter [Sphingomonas sp. Leaf412]|nr:MATE family efflux transporter [Sphingomonas sp. Leaf412]